VLAGQSFESTSEFAVGQVAWQLERAGHPHPGSYHAWLERLEAIDLWRVLYAHDVVIWQRGAMYAAPSVLSEASR
jgi:hypothetical protein